MRNINEKIKEYSKKYHKSEEEIVNGNYQNLLKEFEEWDLVSDKDFINFYSKINMNKSFTQD